MSELEQVKKIINAYPTKCPYCFRKLKPKLFKPDSSVKYYCSVCSNFIDLEWDYLHAIALKTEQYLVMENEKKKIDFRKQIEQ